MLKELQTIFHSITKSLEILYVIEGIKPCARILVFEDKLTDTVKFLESKEIFCDVSGFKVLKQNQQSEFYSDKSIKAGKNDSRKGHFFLYASKKKDIAEEAKIAEEKSDHIRLGKILGYPECCCKFFARNFNEKNTDLTLDALENSDGFEFSFYNNICTRHFDVSLLSHFPHSFGCKPSLEIARKNFEILRGNSREISDFFEKILASMVIYSISEGITIVRKHEEKNGFILYSDVVSTSRSKLYYLISSNSQLRIIDKNSFNVGDIDVSGRDYGVMIFN